jgi:hypothetical protein
MEKRIKIFLGDNPYDVEDVVNRFLKAMTGKLHDVIFDVAFDPHIAGLEYTAVLVFTPEEEHEKKEQRKKESRKGNEGIQRGNPTQRKQRGAGSDKPKTSSGNRAVRSSKSRS